MSAISWKEGAPVSNEFDDIYFSKENGLSETEHVFLKGNNLPDRWNGQNEFTVIETGFGTGLNFFAIWNLWKKYEKSPKKLNFISIEKFPLSADDIKKAISNWPELKEYADEFYKKYSTNNNHIEFANGNIRLSIYFEDVKTALPKIDKFADAWFLDGFAPSKNPDMWTDQLFQNMARLSIKNTSFATFTAAGFVKRALIEHDFDVKKTRGFGKKREMLIGTKFN